MDPVFVVLWMTLALLGGFLVAYIARWDIGASLAILASFMAFGLGLGNLMGNPLWPTLIALALTVGLAWGANHLTLQLRPQTRPSALFIRDDSQEAWRAWTSPRETWGERLARWGFPSS